MPALLRAATFPIASPRHRAPQLRQRRPLSAHPAKLRTVPAVLSIAIIGDNRLLREGLAAMIHSQPGFEVLAASDDVRQVFQQMRGARPEVVLVDFGLQDHDSLRLTATISAELPEARVIVTSFQPAQAHVADFVRAGAYGFIMKDASLEEFFKTIRAVAAGNEVLPAALTNSLFTQIASDVPGAKSPVLLEELRLTHREREVVDLLAGGRSNKAIAAQLHIAVHTVKTHVHKVLEKLELRSRLEVAAFTYAKGWPRPTVTRS